MLDRVTIPRLVVAGLVSGTGKTSVSLALASALAGRGRTVQSFKVGPDFVDCGYLAHATTRPCRNLDTWMLGEQGVLRSLARGSVGADVALVEGANGLFDGHGCPSETPAAPARHLTGSTAEVARLIESPVLLVLDVSRMGETAAAVALGVRQLDPSLNLVGVVLNRTPEHLAQQIEDAVWHGAHVPVLGVLPELPEASISELSDSLLPVCENGAVDRTIERLGRAAERHCDLDLIEKLMVRAPGAGAPDGVPPFPEVGRPVRVGVAFDDAFCHYYAENLELLEAAGAEIVPFSPLEDAGLPRGLDAVYLGGGITEDQVPRLAGNRALLESLRRSHDEGVLILAESGGVLCCARSIRTSDGSVHPSSSIIPIDVAIDDRVRRRGYRELTLAADSGLGPRGTVLRGHEFHSLRLISETSSLGPASSMHDCDGEPLGFEGWAGPSIVATFVQLHYGQDPELAPRLLAAARSRGGRRGVGGELTATA